MGRILIDFHASDADKKLQFIRTGSVIEVVTLFLYSSELVQLTEDQRSRLVGERASKSVLNWAYGRADGGRVQAGNGVGLSVSKMISSSLLKKWEYGGREDRQVAGGSLPAVYDLIEAVLLNYPVTTVENEFRELFMPEALTSDTFIEREDIEHYQPTGLPGVFAVFTTQAMKGSIVDCLAFGDIRKEPGVLVLTRDEYERGHELDQDLLDELEAIVVMQ